MESTHTPTSTDTDRGAGGAKRARRSLWRRHLALGTAVVGAAVIPFGGAHAQRPNSTDFADPLYVACMRNSARTPDALEQYVDGCIDRAVAARPEFETCIDSAARTPDSLEHWVVPCAMGAFADRT